MKKKIVFCLSFGIVLALIVFGHVSIQSAFAVSWFITAFLCMGLGYSFDELQKGSMDYCKQAISPMIFLFCAGTMTGIWNQCGTIPAMTRIGLLLIRPAYFLPLAFLICFAFSQIIGTSFGTVGTMGVVFMTVGDSLGIPTMLCANTIILGSFSGFVFSPLADCINVSSDMAKIPKPANCAAQRRIIVPTALLALGLVLWKAGDLSVALNETDLETARETLGACMKLGLPALFPVVLVISLMLFHLPSILALMSGTLAGIPVALFYQGQSVETALSSLWTGAVHHTGNTWFDSLFTRGGITGMTGTIVLFIGCFSLFGLLNSCGIMDEMLRPLIRLMDTPVKCLWLTAFIAFIASVCSASGMCGIIFTLNLLLPVYDAKEYDRGPLVAAAVTGGMYLSCIIPWHSNVVTPAAFLGVDPTVLAKGNTPVLLSLPVLLILTAVGQRKERRPQN